MFRTANERMAGWEELHPDGVELYSCECADLECREKIKLTKAEYERVRGNSCHFFVVPGHEVSDVESVIGRHDGWLVVEKNDDVAAVVKALDERRD